MTVLPSTLRPFPALDQLTDSELARLSTSLQVNNFRSGAQLCREGDDGEECYFLVDGRVNVSQSISEGRRVQLAALGPGAIFGLDALVPGQRRSADVRASSNVQVLALRRIEQQWALSQGARWAVVLQEICCKNLIGQLRASLRRLSELANEEALADPVGSAPLNASPRPKADRVRETPMESGSSAQRDESVQKLPALPLDAHDASTTGKLLTLLAESEASFAGEGVDLEAVQFITDEDAARRNHNRGRH